MADDSADIEPCTAFMVIPPYGATFDDPRLLARLQRDLEERFPDLVFLVTTEGPGRYDNFFIVPVMIDEGDGTLSDDRGTLDNRMLHDLSRVLAPYIGSVDRVELIVRTGNPGESPAAQWPTRH